MKASMIGTILIIKRMQYKDHLIRIRCLSIKSNLAAGWIESVDHIPVCVQYKMSVLLKK